MGDMKAWNADWPEGRNGESSPPATPAERRSGGESPFDGDAGTRLLSTPEHRCFPSRQRHPKP